MADSDTKTYVLIGDDHNDAFRGFASAFHRRENLKGDVVVLRAEDYPDMAAVAKAITPPARIVVGAHGYDGGFEWNKGQSVPYEELFKLVPRTGIELVTIAGCRGGSAELAAEHLPAGTVLQSLVSNAVPGWGGALTRFAEEVVNQRGPMTSLSFLLKGLDNTDPRDSVVAAESYRKSRPASPQEPKGYDAHDVLPYSYMVGGKPPAHLDLDIEVNNLRGRTRGGPEAKANFEKAVALVFANIDSLSSEGNAPRDIDAVQRQIRETAQNVLAGKTISVEDSRIAYAIAIANLQVSGELGSMVRERQQSAPDALPAIRSQWNGKGDPTIARIQAILEASGYSTDDGGARDGKVTGQMTAQTKDAFGLMRRVAGVDAKAPPEALLEAIRKDPSMMRQFASITGDDGTARVDVALTTPPQSDRGGHAR